ncbi:transcription initiation factor TFIID subunit 4-like isoform X1 [Clavelina lepadiformis]|uniref:transcription initiation factor TFIID subunit 4-like isoform X1 n=1 Tax=Clavelina lepadiformis TaxID=159417 RepID=UPI0040434CD4
MIFVTIDVFQGIKIFSLFFKVWKMTTINGLSNSTSSYVTLNSAHVNNVSSTALSNKQTPTMTTAATKYIQLQSVRPTIANSVATTHATSVVSPAAPQVMNNAVTLPTSSQTPRNPLATNINIPPGMVLTRTSSGQLVLVNGHHTANNTQQPMVTPATRIVTTIAMATNSTLVTTVGKTVSVVAPMNAVSKSEVKVPLTTTNPVNLSQDDMVNVNKCRNFLTTLIKLASTGGQPQETVRNVKTLVQNLIDDKIAPEDFTKQLQTELKSSPQPYLVPFLKKSLPLLRLTMMQQSQVSAVPPAAVVQAANRITSLQFDANKAPASPKPKTVPKVTKPFNKFVRTNVPDIRLPRVSSVGPALKHPSLQTPPPDGPQLQFHAPHPSAVSGAQSSSLTTIKPFTVNPLRGAQKWGATSAIGGGAYKEDDDINDVASMAGVNLLEESARILATNSDLVGTQTRSCEDDSVLNRAVLQKRMSEIASKNPQIQHIHADAIKFLSCAAESRIKDILHKLSGVVCHRMVNFKEEEHYKACGDVKTQLKFLQELDQIEKKKHDEAERDILMRAMKSRSKNDNPEQMRLKERAKEMQQQELEKMQIRNADETARNAIGPRKKRARIDSPMSTTSGLIENHMGTTSRNPTRSRTKRVNLRDLIFVMENEKETCKSTHLYKSYLK